MPRTCPDCSNPVEAGEMFCGECGAYLEWEESQPEAEVVVEVLEAEPEPERPTLVGRVKDKVGLNAAPTVEPVVEPEPALLEAKEIEPPAPDLSPAQEMLVKVPEEATGPRKPQVQTTAPKAKARPDARLVPDEPIRPGDLICGDCGAGNRPDRKFCRRCGHDLKAAEVAKIAWWRRLLARKPKQAKLAGTRPVRRTRPNLAGMRYPVIVVLVLVLGGGGVLMRGKARGVVAIVLDRVQGVEGVEATRAVASSAAPGHPAASIIDTDPTKYWAPDGVANGESVRANFAEPTRLVYLLISPGAATTKKAKWVAVGRPRTMQISMQVKGGAVVTESVDLADEMGTVKVSLGTSNVTSVTMRIQRAYPGQSSDLTALGEVEFFARG